MSFTYRSCWEVVFFETDRWGTVLPRTARFNSGEVMIDFIRRSGGLNALEDRNILDMMMKRNFGEVILNLTNEQNAKLRQVKRNRP